MHWILRSLITKIIIGLDLFLFSDYCDIIFGRLLEGKEVKSRLTYNSINPNSASVSGFHITFNPTVYFVSVNFFLGPKFPQENKTINHLVHV